MACSGNCLYGQKTGHGEEGTGPLGEKARDVDEGKNMVDLYTTLGTCTVLFQQFLVGLYYVPILCQTLEVQDLVPALMEPIVSLKHINHESTWALHTDCLGSSFNLPFTSYVAFNFSALQFLYL